MQCNASLHVISYHMYNECHHLYMTSILNFIHVNISCKHISTSTYNCYVQAMTHTHTQSSHVMASCTYILIRCQYIRTHILTSMHVTLSQSMKLSNKSSQIVTGSPRHNLPSPRRATPSPRQATPSPRRTRKSTNFILGFA